MDNGRNTEKATMNTFSEYRNFSTFAAALDDGSLKRFAQAQHQYFYNHGMTPADLVAMCTSDGDSVVNPWCDPSGRFECDPFETYGEPDFCRWGCRVAEVLSTPREELPDVMVEIVDAMNDFYRFEYDTYNIADSLLEYARGMKDDGIDIEPRATGGGCDFIVARVGDLEIVLSDAEDNGISPQWDDYPSKRTGISELQCPATLTIYDQEHPLNFCPGEVTNWYRGISIDFPTAKAALDAIRTMNDFGELV